MASKISKIKKAGVNYGKNVAGGAKIVGSAVSRAVKVAVKDISQSTKNLPASVIAATGRSGLPQATTGVPRGSSTLNKPSSELNFIQGGNIQDAINTGQYYGSTGKPTVAGASTKTSSKVSDSTALSAGQFGGSTSFQSFSSPNTSLSSSTPSYPTSSVVNAPTVLGASNQKVIFPEIATPDYSKYVPTPIEQAADDAKKDTTLQDYVDSILEGAPSSEDAYKRAQRETDILRKQEEVNTLTGTLNAIVNKGQAQQLAQVGQGRGIPEAILGGISAEIGRQTAISALPVSAQLQAAQGSLESAQQNLDTLYKIYSEDARNEYEYKREVKKIVYEIANEKEKRALEKLDKQEERQYDERQATLKDIKDIATQAMQNQAPAGVLSDIFKAKSYQEAVQVAGKYGGDYLQRELLLQQIENVKSQIAERNNVSNSYGTITGKPQTAAQSSANGYADRVAQADVIISTLGNKFTSKLAIGGSLPNRLQSDDRQMYEQAKRNFVNAVLRRESGAAIAESEFVSAEKQYFPQAGDNSGVVLQKEQSRNTAINNIYREASVNRPVLPGQIIESNGVRYRVGMDGVTLDIIQ